jgi:ComF family protein
MRCSAKAALSFFYPEICQYCREQWAEPAEGFICAECARQVQFIEPPFCSRCGLPFAGELTTPFECANCAEIELHFSYGRAAVRATGMVLDLIHRWKYQRALWLEPFLARLLIQQVSLHVVAHDWDLIVPVPLHREKLLEREFNQAEHLACRLGQALQLPVCRSAVKRIAATPTQTKLTRAARNENMRRAFAPAITEPVRGRRVMLVDDVLTTGATTNACARVLRQAGAAEVCVWTLARGLLH